MIDLWFAGILNVQNQEQSSTSDGRARGLRSPTATIGATDIAVVQLFTSQRIVPIICIDASNGTRNHETIQKIGKGVPEKISVLRNNVKQKNRSIVQSRN